MTGADDDLDDFDPPNPDTADRPGAATSEAETHYARRLRVRPRVPRPHLLPPASADKTPASAGAPSGTSTPEAVARLEALWKAFEHLSHDPTLGAAIWWRDYTDPTMTALTAPDGPFSECGPDAHVTPPPLDVVRPDWLAR